MAAQQRLSLAGIMKMDSSRVQRAPKTRCGQNHGRLACGRARNGIRLILSLHSSFKNDLEDGGVLLVIGPEDVAPRHAARHVAELNRDAVRTVGGMGDVFGDYTVLGLVLREAVEQPLPLNVLLQGE